MKIGFHTDAFNSACFSFEACLQWAQRNSVHYIECGFLDGISWMLGLGYYPHVAAYEDPVLLRRKMENYDVRFSQIDAAYPLSKRWPFAWCPVCDEGDSVGRYGGLSVC